MVYYLLSLTEIFFIESDDKIPTGLSFTPSGLTLQISAVVHVQHLYNIQAYNKLLRVGLSASICAHQRIFKMSVVTNWSSKLWKNSLLTILTDFEMCIIVVLCGNYTNVGVKWPVE